MRKGQTTNNGRIILVAKKREKAKQIYPQKNEPAQAHNIILFEQGFWCLVRIKSEIASLNSVRLYFKMLSELICSF